MKFQALEIRTKFFLPEIPNEFLPFFQGTSSIGDTSEPTIDFQGTFVGFQGSTLPQTNMAPENGWLEY